MNQIDCYMTVIEERGLLLRGEGLCCSERTGHPRVLLETPNLNDLPRHQRLA